MRLNEGVESALRNLKFMKYSNQIAFIFSIATTLLITRVTAQELPYIQRVYPFNDSTTWVEINTFRDLSDDLPNVEIAVVSNRGRTAIDTVVSMFSTIDLRDMNFDKVRDLLVSYTSGARTNTTYHLYLVQLSKNLTKAQNFEDIVNPKLDQNLNVITELRLTSQNCYRFHRLTDEQIISLDTSFCEYPDSTLWTDNTLKQMNSLLNEKEKALNRR